MTAGQRHVIAIGLVLVALTCLFPPLVVNPTDFPKSGGRGFLFSSDLYQEKYDVRRTDSSLSYSSRPRALDLQRLAIEWVLIGSAAGTLAVWLRREPRP